MVTFELRPVIRAKDLEFVCTETITIENATTIAVARVLARKKIETRIGSGNYSRICGGLLWLERVNKEVNSD